MDEKLWGVDTTSYPVKALQAPASVVECTEMLAMLGALFFGLGETRH
jgi:hypothetical protein